ncbi:hypothetical protein [Marichromatium bheemlicum]|uniref:Oligogalacturonide lyase n=1 Tax=Marichromatium bheemlicum TaxID=365339 RepID=A0ABX1I731_9GAMM|nr:hypothetical protein [Marichromatium bheemlicum]NKN33380.1 hypothetical protein [Marichromatium bheemlicum]
MMTPYRQLRDTRLLPWRLRNRLECWVEEVARCRYPALYRWLHLGDARSHLRAVTETPGHHFFGYYDKSPWNSTGEVLLAHRAAFNDRAPSAEDVLELVQIDVERGVARTFAQTRAWNWQQGAMLQWHPQCPRSQVIYNDRRDGRFVAVVHDLECGERCCYRHPLYAVLADGRQGFSLNFARLAVHRPGYGYAGLEDPYARERAPADDGLWHLDLETGEAQLVVSLAQLAARDPKPSMRDAWHYVNHIQPSRGGARLAFFHVWHRDGQGWEVRLYSCRPDGSGLRCLLDTGFISHYDWRDDEVLLVWANRGPGQAPCFQRIDHRAAAPEPFAVDTVHEDGHCSFSPDLRWVINDTYPDRHQMRTLMLLDATTGARRDLARLYSPKAQWWGELRCDLHPRWSRDGRQVCIDSVHHGSRQLYVIDLAPWIGR